VRATGQTVDFRDMETGRSPSAPFRVVAGAGILAISALAPTARASATTPASAATLLAGLASALAAAAALLARSAALATGSTALLLILWHLFLRFCVIPAFS
jgi:hypothetical protein